MATGYEIKTINKRLFNLGLVDANSAAANRFVENLYLQPLGGIFIQ